MIWRLTEHHNLLFLFFKVIYSKKLLVLECAAHLNDLVIRWTAQVSNKVAT